MLADVGVDQIITTHDGDIWAVQNKGRSGEASRGSFPDFTNFEAQAALVGATKLLWVTSAAGLNGTATDYIRARTSLDVVVLNRQWLADELEYPESIASVRLAIEARTEVVPGVPNILRFDQHTALNCLDTALETHNSIQYISACGTGKTTVTHALHNRRDSRLSAFFVPTLGLMKQTIKSWKDQAGSRPFTAIAVCSDDTVVKSAKERMREDHWETTSADLGESLIRDPEALARKISASTKSGHPVVLFVTYHSAQIVVDAQHKFGAPDIDLVIADEAHYLAGTSEFGEVVKDKAGPRPRVRASKRVYATATPRTVSAKDRGLGVDSMDEDSPVFGPRAFTMMMGDGIQLGILNGYRISMLAVPDDTVDDIREGRVVHTANGSVEARYLAAVHGVGAAMTDKENLYVSYHSSVKRAKLFASMCIEEGVASFAEPIWGLQNAGQRGALVDAFKKSSAPSILTNVRCLTEGVDIPKLNGVIFVDPKINPADIGQAVGRSLRLHKDKTTLANIILPIPVPRSVLESGLDAKKIAALIRADGRWKNLYKVIDALGEHDTNVGANIEVVMKRWGVTDDGQPGAYTDRVAPSRGSWCAVPRPHHLRSDTGRAAAGRRGVPRGVQRRPRMAGRQQPPAVRDSQGR
jgi:predicted helicase